MNRLAVAALAPSFLLAVAGCSSRAPTDATTRIAASEPDASSPAFEDLTPDASTDAAASADARAEDADLGCAANADPPDAAPTVFGSCAFKPDDVHHVCNEYGALGPVDTATPSAQASMRCTVNLGGTWSTDACSLAGAVFGCRTASTTGACAMVVTSWFYFPYTGFDEGDACPTGTVVSPR